MLELIEKGGPVMWPIVAGAFIGLAITIERILYFYFTSVSYAEFRQTLVDRLCAGALRDLDVLTAPARPAKDHVRHGWCG